MIPEQIPVPAFHVQTVQIVVCVKKVIISDKNVKNAAGFPKG